MLNASVTHATAELFILYVVARATSMDSIHATRERFVRSSQAPSVVDLRNRVRRDVGSLASRLEGMG